MKKLDLNRNWTVRKEGSDAVKTVNLPHDAMLYEPRSREMKSSGGGGYFENGKYTYTKMFEAPAEWEGKYILLECEAVYQNASVFLNGKLLAERPYGYTDFYVDLSKELKYGEPNELTVVADNAAAPNTRWYSGSGIHRPVWLHVGGTVSVAPQGILVTNKDPETVTVEVRLLGEKEGVTVRTEILDGETVVASAEGEKVTLTVPGARLWSAETPALYCCRVTLCKEGKVLDDAQTAFGFRMVSWSGDGLKVNGKEVLLRGTCIHHDNGILGAACFADAEERRVRILKEAGFNAIRSAHNPMSKSMLDACDRLGMYVMDETFDMWLIHKNPYDYAGETFKKWWKADTAAMIRKDYSHPCVLMYSIGNEISDLGAEEGQKLCREIGDFVRSQDSTRPVTLGINLMLASMVAKGKGLYGNGKEDEKDTGMGSSALDNMPTSTFFNILMNRMGSLMEMASNGKGPDKVVKALEGSLDMPGYNYANARYRKEAKIYPNRPFVGSETLPKMLFKNWQLVNELPQLTGDFMWTGWDYLGESGIGTIQYKDKKNKKKDTEDGLIVSGGAGVVDICGKKRPETHWDRIIWGLQNTPGIGVEPYTHVGEFAAASMWRDTDAVESWSWAGCEGKKSTVVVYSGSPTVELLVNGKSYGKKKVKEDKAHFSKVVYEPGTVTAVAYDAAGNKVSETSLSTAKGGTRISVSPEKTVLKANGQDLCFLDLELVGEDGVVKSSEDRKLTVTVSGAGTLQAFGSARPHMAENFYSDTHTTYYGKALAAVRAGYEPGTIEVTVSGAGLEERKLTLTVE